MLLSQWRKTEVADLTVTDGETVNEYRFTFATMSAYEESKYSALRRKAFTAYVEKFGVPDEMDPDLAEEANAYMMLLLKYVSVLAACTQLEMREYLEAATPEDREQAQWQVVPWPDEWRKPETAIQNIPTATLDYLYETVIMAGNPLRLLGMVPVDENEKKMIRINAKPSAA